MSLLFRGYRDVILFCLLTFLLMSFTLGVLNYFGFTQQVFVEAWRKTWESPNSYLILPSIAIGLAVIAIIIEFDELMKWGHPF